MIVRDRGSLNTNAALGNTQTLLRLGRSATVLRMFEVPDSLSAQRQGSMHHKLEHKKQENKQGTQ